MKIDEKLSASAGFAPDPPTPLGALPPDPRYRLALHALAMVPPWQIQDPPLHDDIILINEMYTQTHSAL